MNPSIYTVGGTVQAGQGIYVARKADDELFALCQNGTFTYVLTARQMGKSSLMVHTAERLATVGTHVALLDLTKLGVKASADQWYLGLLTELADQLGLALDVLDWWHTHAHLPLAQRLNRFCTEVVLRELAGPVVIFIDELDTTLSLDFTDDFFAVIRALYNARADDAHVRRLTFVLIGVATPGDLIRDPKRTPFNLGTQVELDDFTLEEAAPFAEGFGLPEAEAQTVLGHVLAWTGGHPYLTQRLCQALIAREEANWDAEALAATVRQTFFGAQSEQDHNLQFVRDMLLERTPDRIGGLKLYQTIRSGRQPVRDEEQSPIYAHLKLSGLVRRREQRLYVRNRIYAEVFDQAWIRRHWPLSWWQGIPMGVRIASGFAVVLLVVSVTLSVLLLQALGVTEAQQRTTDAQRLGFAAQIQLETDPNLSLMLAYEGFARNRDLVSRDAMREALTQQIPVQTFLKGHSDRIVSAAYSPDGQRIVTASFDQTAIIWNATNGAKLTTLQGHSDWVRSAVYSPDGQRIVTASQDGTAIIWDAASGAKLTTLQGHSDAVYRAVYSPDGKRIVTASWDQTAIIWDAASGAKLTTLQGHSDGVWSAAYSPNGKHIVTASDDGTAIIWDAASGAKLTTLQGHSSWVNSAAYSPDGKRIVTASWDQIAIIWDAASGTKLLTLQGHSDALWSAAYSPNGKHIVTASNDGTAIIWDAVSGAKLTTLQGHISWVHSAAYSPDGQRIVTASADQTAIIWNADATSGTESNIFRGHTNWVQSAVYSPDGLRIVTASEDSTAIIWDAASGAKLATLQGHSKASLSAAYSPDGKRIVSASGDQTAIIWDATSGAKLTTLQGHSGVVWSAAYSPDGQRIVTASSDQTAIIWDAASGAKLATLQGHSGVVWSAAYSPDGKRIVTASADPIIWDATSGAKLTTLQGHSGVVWSAAYSPDGQRIVTASEDRTAIIWDATSGAKLFTLQGHGGEVFSAAYSPDGQRIVTASADRTAIIWDAANGTKLATLRSHTGAVLSAAFSPDGRRIVTASKDRTAQQHMNLSDDDMVLMAQCRFWRSFTPGESAGFGVYEPFAFSLTNRQCPPVYSWQRPQP